MTKPVTLFPSKVQSLKLTLLLEKSINTEGFPMKVWWINGLSMFENTDLDTETLLQYKTSTAFSCPLIKA